MQELTLFSCRTHLEDKKKTKTENKILEQKNLVLINACAVLTDKHNSELESFSQGYLELVHENLRLRSKIEEKLKKISLMLMRMAVLEAPFKQWVAVVRESRLQDFSRTSEETLRDFVDKCRLLHEEEMLGREKVLKLLALLVQKYKY